MKFFCLVNPASGESKGVKLLAALRALKSAGRISGEIEPLDVERFTAQIERAAACDALLVAGGDGTISRAAAALAGRTLPLGILPLGVGNDLAKELGVFRLFSLAHPERLIALYAEGAVRPLALGEIALPDGRSVRFTNYLSFGFDADAVVTFSALRGRYRRIARTCGRVGNLGLYAWSGAVRLGSRLPMPCEVRDLAGGAQFHAGAKKALIFSNIRSYTGIGRVTKDGSPFDGVLECTIIDSIAAYGRIFLRCSRAAAASAAGFEVATPPPPLSLQIDGEPYAAVPGGRFRITPSGSVRVLLPKAR